MKTLAPVAAPLTAALRDRYRSVRAFTEYLCEPLAVEDFVVQTMADVSPTKWHLAHTTWFWETFVLREHLPGYALFHERYPYLFNSYYVQAGERHCRDKRGYLSRPTVAEVFEYRAHVDAAMDRLLADETRAEALRDLLEVGLNHEQQHQELLLTDIKHVLSVNPLRPVYRAAAPHVARVAPPLGWVEHGGRCLRGRPRRAGLLLRQRDAAPPRLSRTLRARHAPRHLRRVPAVYGRWRLPHARAVALGRLGHRAGERLAGAVLLGARRRGRLHRLHPRGRAGGRPAASPSRTCRFSRPRRLPAGPGRACPPRPSGRWPPLGSRSTART